MAGRQLQLFHFPRDPFPGIEIRDRSADPQWYAGAQRYSWQCGRCGQRGSTYSWPRPDLLRWARENHVCREVWADHTST